MEHTANLSLLPQFERAAHHAPLTDKFAAPLLDSLLLHRVGQFDWHGEKPSQALLSLRIVENGNRLRAAVGDELEEVEAGLGIAILSLLYLNYQVEQLVCGHRLLGELRTLPLRSGWLTCGRLFS